DLAPRPPAGDPPSLPRVSHGGLGPRADGAGRRAHAVRLDRPGAGCVPTVTVLVARAPSPAAPLERVVEQARHASPRDMEPLRTAPWRTPYTFERPRRAPGGQTSWIRAKRKAVVSPNSSIPFRASRAPRSLQCSARRALACPYVVTALSE